MHRFGTVVKNSLDGLNIFNSTKLTLNSDVDPDT